jgi:hypothetical protein
MTLTSGWADCKDGSEDSIVVWFILGTWDDVQTTWSPMEPSSTGRHGEECHMRMAGKKNNRGKRNDLASRQYNQCAVLNHGLRKRNNGSN